MMKKSRERKGGPSGCNESCWFAIIVESSMCPSCNVFVNVDPDQFLVGQEERRLVMILPLLGIPKEECEVKIRHLLYVSFNQPTGRRRGGESGIFRPVRKAVTEGKGNACDFEAVGNGQTQRYAKCKQWLRSLPGNQK